MTRTRRKGGRRRQRVEQPSRQEPRATKIGTRKRPPTRKRASSGRWIAALVGLVLLGAVLRGLYLHEILAAPDFAFPVVDPGYSDYWARGLVTGDWTPPAGHDDPEIPTTPYFRPPGYPYFLALIYWLGSPSYLLPRIIQMGLGLVNCVLVFSFARRWFGHGVAVIAAAVMSSYWVFIYFEGELHEPALLIFLYLAMIYSLGLWAQRPTFLYAFAGGLLLGLSALVRPNALLFVPVGAVWMFWVWRRRGTWQRSFASAAGFVLGVVVAVAPATIRNYVVARDLVLISSNGGINLLIGNNESATGLYVLTIPGFEDFKLGTCYDYPNIVEHLEKQQGRSLKHSEVSSYFSGLATRYIRDHPFETIGLTFKKAVTFWDPGELSHNKQIHYERKFSRVLGRLPGSFAVISSMSLVGVVLLLGRRKDPPEDKGTSGLLSGRWREVSVLMVLFVGTYFVSFLPFFNTGLYRVPIIPFLVVFAANAARHVGGFAAARDLKRVAGWGLACGVMYLVARTPFYPTQPNLATWHYDRGVAYGKRGDQEESIREFRAALEVKPNFSRAHHNLGRALMKRGRIDEAIEHYRDAIRITPRFREAHTNLGNALANRGEIEQSIAHHTEALRIRPDFADAHVNLGTVLATRGTVDEAIRHYREALRINPNHAKAHYNLGNSLLSRRDNAEAVEHYRQAVRINPGYVKAHVNMAIALERQGNIEDAVRHCREALRIQPDFTPARLRLGKVLRKQGKIDEAIAAFREVLRIRPGHARARQALDEALAERNGSNP